ncbi:MAG: YebC/PmpR family DNA-binding transcriptional regulator [Deltaproteobacteria bacterium]|nr:YebC/PmpR family DNA-binding transcriptional regulator [Deltaproteobacteria bacterium]
MSGHSKWATIKRKKGAEDAKRGKVFTKFIREITVAARQGGGDPSGNPRLRTVIDKAKQANMPQDNIARAIKKGTGELEGAAIEEHVYEGYGPGGAAIILEIMTDNRNRTISEIRNILSKNGGNLGEAGCVGWIFKKKGVIQCDKGSVQEDQLMEIALDAGAEDIKDEEDVWDVLTAAENFEEVKKGLLSKGLKFTNAEITMVPENTVQLTGSNAEKMLHLVEALEDHDDVQNVYSNFDIPKEEMERISRLVA